MIKRLTSYLPTAIVVIIVLYATLVSHPVMVDEIPPIPHIDKVIHAVMMGGVLSAFAFDWQRAHPGRRLSPSLIWAIFGCVVAFSIADELVQGALGNGRSSDPYDLLADIVGALGAAYLAPPAIRKVLNNK